jgi:flagellar basal body-associated protein FliL
MENEQTGSKEKKSNAKTLLIILGAVIAVLILALVFFAIRPVPRPANV